MAENLPAEYRPSEDEEYMNPRQLEYFRQKLLTWKQQLITESQATIRNLQTEDWREPDPIDRASHEEEAALELRTRDRYRKLLSKIDAALGRIEDGSYGFCEDTGEPIGIQRLEARPTATMTIEAQEKHEQGEKIRRE